MTKPCPDCGVAITATASRCACGWKSAALSRPSTDHASEDRTLCCFELLGRRCQSPWVIGRNGRRYCREHDPRTATAAERMHVTGGVGDFDKLRAIVGAAPPIPRANVKRPDHVTGPVRPISEHFGGVPQRFETTERDVPADDGWAEGRE